MRTTGRRRRRIVIRKRKMGERRIMGIPKNKGTSRMSNSPNLQSISQSLVPLKPRPTSTLHHDLHLHLLPSPRSTCSMRKKGRRKRMAAFLAERVQTHSVNCLANDPLPHRNPHTNPSIPYLLCPVHRPITPTITLEDHPQRKPSSRPTRSLLNDNSSGVITVGVK